MDLTTFIFAWIVAGFLITLLTCGRALAQMLRAGYLFTRVAALVTFVLFVVAWPFTLIYALLFVRGPERNPND